MSSIELRAGYLYLEEVARARAIHEIPVDSTHGDAMPRVR